MFKRHPPYKRDLAPSDFHLFLRFKKFLPGQRQHFQKGREPEMSVTQWFQSQAADFYDTACKRWSHGMTNVSFPEVNVLKNSSTLAVSVPINFSIELRFVSVNGTRETYFVDAPRRLMGYGTPYQANVKIVFM